VRLLDTRELITGEPASGTPAVTECWQSYSLQKSTAQAVDRPTPCSREQPSGIRLSRQFGPAHQRDHSPVEITHPAIRKFVTICAAAASPIRPRRDCVKP
jgi:hypothetical protein